MSTSVVGDAWETYESSVRVFLACTRDWVPEGSVTIDNIEEDLYGRDVVTFTCPRAECGEVHRSLRVA